MTNKYSIVDGKDGEPTVCNKEIKIRGYYAPKIVELVEEYGWEQAAKKVCSYCGGYIQAENEHTEINHKCGCEEPTQSNPEVPL